MNQTSGTPNEVLMQAMKGLRYSGDYSDMTIVCDEDVYKVHKVVICSRSEYFRKVFDISMEESHTSRVDLSGHSPEAVRYLIDFFYLLDYAHDVSTTKKAKKKKKKYKSGFVDELPPEPAPEVPESVPESVPELPNDHLWISPPEPPLDVLGPAKKNETSLLDHCRVYALADYTQVQELKALAASKFKTEVEVRWDHPEFFEAIQEVYQTSTKQDRGLRDIVVDVLSNHKELLDIQDYQDLVSRLDLSFELLIAVQKANGWGGGSKPNGWCNSCGSYNQ
ncbi:BTB/POZ protein [Plectosphaerella plurivora]|uniref:BTB/POZ protein n=1 Tax=Plectosphaerella plurivora TaxID=936078 RepID=A0A9P9A828_9PEZI|nr:BTB/POZ protein [Plectosphaerella plurivora]